MVEEAVEEMEARERTLGTHRCSCYETWTAASGAVGEAGEDTRL